MTKTCSLSAEKRDSRNLNQAGKVQAVFYGFKTDPTAVFVDASEVLRVFRQVGMSALFDLDLDGKKTQVLIKDIVLHPVKNDIMHVDFFAVNPKKKTNVKIPFNFIGTPPAVKNFGGVFAISHKYLEVRCLPGDIPESFTIDVSILDNMGMSIKISDANIGDKFELTKMAPNVAICSIMGRAKKIEAEGEGAPAAEEAAA